MVHSMVFASGIAFRSCLVPGTSILTVGTQPFVPRMSQRLFRVRAVQESDGPRRLVGIIRVLLEVSRNYFKSPSRRALFGGISLLGEFYVAQTISLSFGALGVNDVIAAVVCHKILLQQAKGHFPCCPSEQFQDGFYIRTLH